MKVTLTVVVLPVQSRQPTLFQHYSRLRDSHVRVHCYSIVASGGLRNIVTDKSPDGHVVVVQTVPSSPLQCNDR